MREGAERRSALSGRMSWEGRLKWPRVAEGV